METQGQADWKKYAGDLYEDTAMRRIGRLFPYWVLVSLLIPTAAGFVLSGFNWKGALEGYIWGGLVRIFFEEHHVHLVGRSICHIFGRRRFRHRGQVHERLVAGAVLARRVVASQSPRVPGVRSSTASK